MKFWQFPWNIGYRIGLIGLCLLLNAAGAVVHAQPVYRQVGPDGTVRFSDRPIQSPQLGFAPATPIWPSRASPAPPSPWEGLPFELRQIATRFPVVLYSADNCTPCNGVRSLLQVRGVPFIEHTVSTPEDGQALRRLSGDTVLPFITIGGQKISGFNERELQQFLDAAAYPKTSILPGSYRQAAPRPLTQTQPQDNPNALSLSNRPADPDPGSSAQPAQAPSPTLPLATPSNPAGIRF